ncbi:hypothetical protein Tco_0042827, partial [Tanacetum coccineum]
GDCGRGVVLLQTFLIEIQGFLEKFEEGFEEDMKNEDGQEKRRESDEERRG